MNAPPETIFALSSGSPPAAIAVIRISGPRASDALLAVAGRIPRPRQASLARIVDPKEGELLDRALILFFPGPGSATGEDLAELHLHGGRSVVSAVEQALAGLPGLRRAAAGEFTRRAFENRRLDLTEAEGIADLLEAETQSQRRSALALAGGALSREVDGWQERLLGVAAQVEAEIDFSDEDDVSGASDPRWKAMLSDLLRDVDKALCRPAAERLRDGVRVVIAGPPNAGKSTLMNGLAGRDVAITSPIAGTTRDVVEAPVAMSGYPFVLVDTAGLRDSDDSIEAIGVDRARANLDLADLILWLGAPSTCPDRARSILVSAKRDVEAEAPGCDIAVSAVTGQGMEQLLSILCTRAAALLPGEGEAALHRRHREALSAAAEALTWALEGDDILVAAEGLRQARHQFDRVTGRAGVENMLDALFGRFCIGK